MIRNPDKTGLDSGSPQSEAEKQALDRVARVGQQGATDEAGHDDARLEQRHGARSATRSTSFSGSK